MLGNLFPEVPTHPEDYAEATERNNKKSRTQCPGVTGGKEALLIHPVFPSLTSHIIMGRDFSWKGQEE